MPLSHIHPAARLSLLLALLAGAAGCPGHLDQIGWATPDGGSSASVRMNDDDPPGPMATPTPTPMPTPMPMPAPPRPADGGAAPDANWPKPASDAAPPPPAPDASPPPPAPDAGPAAPLPTPVCATATEIADKILTPKCAQCHGRNAPAAGLDLVTTGIKTRLLNVAARGCSGKVLVTAGDRVGGHFFDKLYGGVAGCGGQMPFGAPPLSEAEIKCLKDWIKPTP